MTGRRFGVSFFIIRSTFIYCVKEKYGVLFFGVYPILLNYVILQPIASELRLLFPRNDTQCLCKAHWRDRRDTAIKKNGVEKHPGDELKIGVPELPPLRQQDKLPLPIQRN